MKNRIWKFSGRGNYSRDFGWDDGLSGDVGEETTIEAALEEQSRAVAYSHTFNSAPLDGDELDSGAEGRGVYVVFFNEHGGSREVWGYVVGANKIHAHKLVERYCDDFEVIEYERPENER